MADEAINVSEQKGEFRDKVNKLLPEGNLNLCLTCGTCAVAVRPPVLKIWIPGSLCGWWRLDSTMK